jgi:acyl-CoA thioesterase-1
MKILCLGDSLTEGYNISQSKSWPKLLELELNCEVINAGISGDTTTGMLSRCERLLLTHKPSHIIVLGGTNDLWFGLKDEFILSNIHAIRRQSRYHNVIPVIGIPTPSLNLNELNLVHENYSECIRSFKNTLIAYCKEDEQPIIDFGLKLESEHFLEDALHINESGQKIMMLAAKQYFFIS